MHVDHENTLCTKKENSREIFLTKSIILTKINKCVYLNLLDLTWTRKLLSRFSERSISLMFVRLKQKSELTYSILFLDAITTSRCFRSLKTTSRVLILLSETFCKFFIYVKTLKQISETYTRKNLNIYTFNSFKLLFFIVWTPVLKISIT